MLPDGGCEQGKCWRLRRLLYGMQPAASASEKHYSKTRGDMGLAKGQTAATVFYDKAREIRCVVHRDDFTFLGWEEDLNDVRDGMKAKYELRVRRNLGGEWGAQREVTILKCEQQLDLPFLKHDQRDVTDGMRTVWKLPVNVASKNVCLPSTCPEVPVVSCFFDPILFVVIRVFSAMRLCLVL